MALPIPRIRRVPGGNVQMGFPGGESVTFADSVTDAEQVVDKNHPYFEVLQHLFAVLAERGRTAPTRWGG